MTEPFVIEVNSQSILDALNRLLQAGHELDPVFRALGEDIVDRTKQRFATGTAPDGTPWAPNSDTTLRKMLHGKSDARAAFSHIGSRKKGSAFVGYNKGYFNKDGSLAKKSLDLLANKKPLIGESGDLSQQIGYQADSDSLTVFASPVYAAIQQFGGKKSQFPNLWGDIPARPFLPVRPGDQSLYPDEHQSILDAINAHLQQAWEG